MRAYKYAPKIKKIMSLDLGNLLNLGLYGIKEVLLTVVKMVN